MKKPIVIAGNGPSVANINYKRVPKDFDCFRVNQFAFEDKYYLGRNITGYFLPGEYLHYNYFLLYTLQLQGIYNIEEYYISTIHRSMELNFLVNVYDEIDHHHQFSQFLSYYRAFYYKSPSVIVIAIMKAILLGYTDILLVGVDFFHGGHVYNIQKKKNGSVLRTSNIDQDPQLYHTKLAKDNIVHSVEMEKSAVLFLSKLPNIKIYSICDNTPLNDLVPLAPELEEYFIGAEEKPAGTPTDWLELPKYQEQLKQERLEQERQQSHKGVIQKIKQRFVDKNMGVEWNALRENIYLKLVYHAIKPFWIVLKFFLKK